MADRRLAPTPTRGADPTRFGPFTRVRARWAVLPWWARVLIVYAAARAVTTVFLLLLAAQQAANAWTGASPGYAAFATIWDGTWYHFIAVAGYPTELPLTEEGEVAENAWAFMPAYPSLVRVLMLGTGLGWDVVAVTVSILFGIGAALLFFSLMRRFLDDSTAMFSVVLFSVAPVSPLFQLSYAESMHTFLLLTALHLLVTRSYGCMFAVIAAMSLTRPSGLAFALALALHLLHRFLTRTRDPFPVRERVLVAALAAFSGLMGFVWLLAAWVVTGSPTAYTDTELAWRAGYIGYVELIPFTPWFQGGVWWLGPIMGPIVVILIIVAFAGLLLLPAVRRLGVDLRIWVASYGLYLFAVFFPQSSVFRLLLPMFPLVGAIAVPASRLYRVGMVVLFLAGQWGWLLICWRVDGYDWTPP